MDTKIALVNAKNISSTLKNVPEVKKSCQWMESNPKKLAKIIQTYLDSIGHLENYTEQEIKLIEKANKLMKKRKVRKTSASNLRANTFLKSLDKQQRKSLKNTAIQAFNPESPVYQKALRQLAEMMFGGHQMFASGEIPRDGDPASDKVIWGHTQARKDIDPIILVHFIISHYLARFFTHALNTPELIKNKDAFLAVLTDVILLEGTKKPNSTQILDIWLTPKEKGGLGWLVQEQIDAYHDIALNKD